jgi:uncharacterized protein YjbI with pentapeptide repeats
MPPYLHPERALVRPRVLVGGSAVPRLLEDEVAELLARGGTASVQLVGAPGSGRTTALAHLAAVFAGDARLALRDADGAWIHGDLVTITAAERATRERGAVWTLSGWTDDDVLEYLVAAHRAEAAHAFAAWRSETIERHLGRWPGLCRLVLDQLAAGHATAVLPALRCVLDEVLPVDPRPVPGRGRAFALEAAVRHCAVGNVESSESPSPRQPLLAVPIVRAMLAGEGLIDGALRGVPVPRAALHRDRLVRTALGTLLPGTPREQALLNRCCLVDGEAATTALSLLCAATPRLRPPVERLQLAQNGYFARADLHGLELCGYLTHGDFTAADLRHADLRGSFLRHARVAQARLDGARVDGVQAQGLDARSLAAPGVNLRLADLSRGDFRDANLDRADLHGANLTAVRLDGASMRGADLTQAFLVRATLDGADLRGARCTGARMIGLDLRNARLEGASLDQTNCERADLSGTALPALSALHANFQDAALTDTAWPRATLRGATFRGAGLAGVDWSGADLRDTDFRGASFHLGSARSGLVGSDVPSEGSRTGFYTDESLEDRFQAPEDVRKANLRGCDLRGAVAEDCDFYLVDLRGARLDAAQLDWLRRCRAILDRETAAS